MKEQDASRINGAFNQIMSQQSKDKQKIEHLEKSIAEQNLKIAELESRLNGFIVKFFNGNATAV